MSADDRLPELPGLPLSEWQTSVLASLRSGQPITVTMPMRHSGRAALEAELKATRLVSDIVTQAARRAYVVTDEPACPGGCCVVTFDRQIGLPSRADGGGQWARPMFEVLDDAGLFAREDVNPFSEDVMTVPVEEYDRPDRIFL